MSSNEPVLAKIFEVVERWVTVDVWVRDSICTNDIIPYEWFWALEYYRTYIQCSLSIYLVRNTEG